MARYIAKEEMLNEVIKSKEKGQITNRLAEMFLQLVERYSRNYNWRGYSYVDDMRGEALANLCRYWDRFDHKTGQNPFSYYTQMVANSFKLYLSHEHKIRKNKDTFAEAYGLDTSFAHQHEHEALP